MIALEGVGKSYRTGRKRKVVISDASGAAAGVSVVGKAFPSGTATRRPSSGPATSPRSCAASHSLAS